MQVPSHAMVCRGGWTHKVCIVDAESDVLQDGPHTGAGPPTALVPHEQAPTQPSAPICGARCVPLYDCVLQRHRRQVLACNAPFLAEGRKRSLMTCLRSAAQEATPSVMGVEQELQNDRTSGKTEGGIVVPSCKADCGQISTCTVRCISASRRSKPCNNLSTMQHH